MRLFERSDCKSGRRKHCLRAVLRPVGSHWVMNPGWPGCKEGRGHFAAIRGINSEGIEEFSGIPPTSQPHPPCDLSVVG